MKDNQTKCYFIELRAQGLSYDRIVKELGVSKQTLINWGKFFDSEIFDIQKIQLESLLEKHKLTKQARIEFFGKQLARVKKELGKRNLTKVSTEKLFDLIIKMENEV